MQHDNTELIDAMVTYNNTGELSEYLYNRLLFIARGVVKRRNLNDADREDYEQDCMLQFVKHAHHIDLNNNPFAYLSQVFLSQYHQRKRIQRFDALEQDVVRLGYVSIESKCKKKNMFIDDTPVVRASVPVTMRKRKLSSSNLPYLYLYQGSLISLKELADIKGMEQPALYKRVRKAGLEKGDDISHLVG